MENKFRISIGSCPTLDKIDLKSHKYLDHDLQLVKAALLYADEITLCSPSCTMIASVVALGELAMSSSPKDKIKFFEEITPKDKLPPNYFYYKSLLEKKHLSGKEIIAKKHLVKILNNFWSEFRKSGFELADGVNLEGFVTAFEAGYLNFYQFKDINNDNIGKSMINEFVEYIFELIKSVESYPLLDDFASELIKAGILEGKINIASIDKTRSKHIGLVTNLFQRLPIFELADVKELIDIRAELNQYLSRFRSGIMKYSNDISSETWDEDFKKASEEIFYKDIEPTLIDIEDAIKSNKYLIKLTDRYSSSPQQFAVPVVSVALTNFSNIPDLISLAFGGASIVANIYDVFNKWKEEFNKIKQNQLFFYYELKRKL